MGVLERWSDAWIMFKTIQYSITPTLRGLNAQNFRPFKLLLLLIMILLEIPWPWCAG